MPSTTNRRKADEDHGADVTDIRTAAPGLELDADATPESPVEPFRLWISAGGKRHEFLIPEPDAGDEMDMTDCLRAYNLRGFLQLALGDQWATARPLIEGMKDRNNLLKIVIAYSQHFELDSSPIEAEANRAARRARRRRR